VNKGAITNEMNPTASIWRMKQLGEKDQQYQDHTTKGEAITDQKTINITVDGKDINLGT